LGDVISTTQALDGVGGSAWQVAYSYDYPAGVYTTTYPSGVAAVATLDPLGRVDLVQQDNGGLSTVADYSYDDLNSFWQISYGNGAVNRFDYDALRRTTRVQLTANSNTLADYGYGYDDAGNRTYLQRSHLTGDPADVYQYDGLYQLTQAWYGADATAPGSITSYDDRQTYSLDTLGNRLEVSFDDNITTTVQPYGQHDNSQLSNGMNRYDVVDDNPLSYDLRGNTLADGLTTNSYGYDVLNRQITVTNGSDSAEYIYDAMGRRIAKVVTTTAGVTTTHFIYDKQFRVIEERSSQSVWQARYTYGSGIDEVLLMERNSSSYYLHRDALGSITEITNSSGSLVERYEYDVYGEPEFYDGSYSAITESTIGNPYLFTARRYDPESGNYYYRARIYSPALGRFLSMDPLGYEAGDANLYRYVFNNPANLTDPTGEIVPILIAVAVLATKAIDYGLTLYDIIQARQTIADPCVPPEEKLLAGLTIALAVGLELVEPDDLLPVGLPADDIARRAVVKQARRALQEGGIEGFVRSVKNQLGDSADNILRELGLGEYVDDVAQKGDNLVNDAVGAICSFSADTLVSTPYGFAAISELAEGQYVLAYDEATGELIYAPILATWVHEDPLIVHLTIDGELIQTTPEHPFRLANGDWVPAAALEIGSQIQRANGTTGIVQAIDFNYDSQLMYNLTVAAAHTFFVGEGQWLVHNDCGKWIKVNESMSPRAAAYQSRITGRSIDEAYSLGGVKFDGFTNGTLVDAKGPGYSQFIENGQFAAWYRGKDELLDQANRQIKAAEGRHPIVWHVAESDAFIVIRDLLQSKGFNAITVKHTP
jgi:RHS repeat-associated protein